MAPDAVEEVRQDATRIQREGPCYFGHDFTTSMYKGQPQWTANPEPSFWYDVEPGVSLCQKCYTRGRAAMIRQGGQTTAKPRNAANHAEDGPPTKARRTNKNSQTTAAESTAPAAKKARTDNAAAETRRCDEPLPVSASASAARPPGATEGELPLSTARPPG